ncbi:hypothetical protein ACKWTF_016411 [Chironomus riparius]
MSQIIKLSSFLKPLEVLNLQFFSLSKLNCPSRFSKQIRMIYFICYIVMTILSTLHLYPAWYASTKIRMSGENLLLFSLEVLMSILAPVQAQVAYQQALLKTRSNQSFFKHLIEFDRYLKWNMRSGISFKNFRKILIRRLILISLISFVAIQKTMYIVIKLENSKVLATFIRFLYMMTVWFTLYKICFYVDIICICLIKFHHILDQIVSFSHNRKLLLRKIYQCKRCYIYIIEIVEELNYFMSVTINFVAVTGILWISLRSYQLLQFAFDKRGSAFDILIGFLFAILIMTLLVICCQNVEIIVS